MPEFCYRSHYKDIVKNGLRLRYVAIGFSQGL
jgi:hypothetical protein